MDVNKYLIIIKNEDKTDDIINYENNRNLINVKYRNTEKVYSYSRRDFQFYKNPTEIDIKNQKIILNQGYVYNVIRILKFEVQFLYFKVKKLYFKFCFNKRIFFIPRTYIKIVTYLNNLYGVI